MTTHIQRGVLTDAILAKLGLTGKPVGDHEKPRSGAGWTGEPNADGSNFTPYVVVSVLAATNPTGPLGDSQADMILPYALTAYGVSRKQCEWMADASRAAITTLENTNVSMTDGQVTYNRRVLQVLQQQIGACQRASEVEPPYYAQTDIVALWTSR